MSDVKFLRLPEVRDRVGMSRSQIYKLIQQGDFPAPLKLSARMSVWPDPEVRAWQDAKLAAAGRSAA